MEAAWKEAMRWMPTLPLCVPRATLQEDVYNGWHIPRDTLIFINAGYAPPISVVATFPGCNLIPV